jgi:hypothetical protein
MSLCMIVLIVTRKRGDGRYYFALWQTNNNTPNKMLISESVVSCLLRVRSVSFTSRAKGCIKFVPHSCLVFLSHEVGVFLEEAICYFIYAKFAVMSLKVVHQYVKLLRIMSIPTTFRLFRVLTSEVLGRRLPVFTLLLWQRQHFIVVDAVDYK